MKMYNLYLYFRPGTLAVRVAWIVDDRDWIEKKKIKKMPLVRPKPNIHDPKCTAKVKDTKSSREGQATNSQKGLGE